MAPAIAAVFEAGELGPWRIESVRAQRGESLPFAPRLAVHEGPPDTTRVTKPAWCLRGTTGHVRYVEAAEKRALAAIQPPLGRAEATRAAMIPIRKSDAWWDLAQDERRAVLETRSHHIAIGLDYLPAIARRLYHARELGEAFDFVTWFEYAPEHAEKFETLVAALRTTEEWKYVEREIDIRLSR